MHRNHQSNNRTITMANQMCWLFNYIFQVCNSLFKLKLKVHAARAVTGKAMSGAVITKDMKVFFNRWKYRLIKVRCLA